MSPINWKSCFVGALVATAVSLPLAGSTQALEQVLSAQERRTRLAQESQERIDSQVKDTRKLSDQFKAASANRIFDQS